MTPLIGRTLILAALFFAAAGSMLGFAAGAKRSVPLLDWARRFAYGFAAAMLLASLTMIFALVRHDFSVSYVAQVGSRALPLWVTIVSFWSSLEGSILFWGCVLGFYIAASLRSLKREHDDYTGYAIGVWLACATFFSFLIAGPAQPFLTLSPAPLDGPGPNPLLQNHILMAVHPPMLYLGYVGMTIPFGLACAALLRGRIGQNFLPVLRTSLLVPWIFLSVAIVLGGWWAYEVLGWGGYWAWDPVENASLLPWLTATAALHSAIVMERRGILKGWTLTLYLSTFLLTILGTFMTRSGVFNSVHSFTQSSIGPTILVFLAMALVWSIVLLSLRIDRLTSDGAIEGLQSREAMFLVNNLLFVLLTFTVLIGTLFPLIVEATRNVQMSVGRPYFDRMSVPAGLALLFLIGIGPALPWGRASREQVRKALLPPLSGAVLGLAIGVFAGARNAWALITFAAGGYALYTSLREMAAPVFARMAVKRESFGRAFIGAQLQRGQRRFGAYVIHLAAVFIFISIAVSSTMGTTKEVQLRRGESTMLGNYKLTFLGASERQEPHRFSTIAAVRVERGGKLIAEMTPRMNVYERQREPIGTPDVKTRLTHDIYLSIMNIDAQRQTLGLNAMINPMVAWIWGATALLAFGGIFALLSRRKSVVVTTRVAPTDDLGDPAGEAV